MTKQQTKERNTKMEKQIKSTRSIPFSDLTEIIYTDGTIEIAKKEKQWKLKILDQEKNL